MNRRMLLRIAASGAAAEFVTKRELEAQSRVERATRGMPSPKITDVRANSDGAFQCADLRGEGSNGSGRAVWLRLRFFHVARWGGRPSGRPLLEAAPGRQGCRPDRRYLADVLQLLLLAEWSRSQQCHQRRGP